MSGPGPDTSAGLAADVLDSTRPSGAPSPPDATAAAPLAPNTSIEAVPPRIGADLDRRRFFRQFATDIVHTAATVVGAATALQRSSAEAASAILNSTAARTDEVAVDVAADGAADTARANAAVAATPASASSIGSPRAAVGYHSAFRVEGDRIVLVNQRRLPIELVEVDCRTAIDVANEIGDRTIVGGPAVAQAAALGLALSANRVRQSRPYARRAILRAAETTLVQARPTSRQLRAAVERVMARYQAIGELDEDGDQIADAMQQEADAIVFEASEDHGRLADAAASRIPRRTDRPAGVLTLGSTGAMAGGQFGTALGTIQAATYAEHDVHVYVLEGRPTFDGARVAAWELAQAGIPHTLVTDAAAGWLLQGGLVDVVLVGAEAIALNGDLANDTGTYPVAALAGRHDVPLIVCAPLSAVDPTASDGRALATAARSRQEVVEVARVPMALADTPALNPVVDITPAALVTAFSTEEGLLGVPFERELSAALERRAARRMSSITGAAAIADAATAPAASGPVGGGT